jgi:hypothetical protein
MKVPDHVYVLGHSYTCYTYSCYAYHFYAYRLYFINVIAFVHCFPTPQNPRFHTCAYVTHIKNNVSRSIEIRQVLHDTRISNGQWPRRDVTNLCGVCAVRWARSYEIRHIHVNTVRCLYRTPLEDEQISYRKSNEMSQCIKILFHIYVKLNIFRATHRPSSGA